jgi:hypothetical protein
MVGLYEAARARARARSIDRVARVALEMSEDLSA